MHGKNRMNKNSKLSMRWNNAQSSHYVKITFWQQAHAFYAISFFQVCKNFEQRNPYKFDLLHLNFHHKATSYLKAWIYLYFYKMCGIFFFKKWTAKKYFSVIVVRLQCSKQLKSNFTILPTRESSIFRIWRRHLNSNIKCECKNIYRIFHLW